MRIGIDIGGTFTDFVVYDEEAGTYRTFKRLSTPRDPAEGVLAGLRELLGPPAELDARIIHGSTVATNALLEREGARTALVATRGFRDLLRIGRQTRPDLYDLFPRRPPPVVPPHLSFGITERVDRRGEVLEPLEEEELAPLVGRLREAGVESVCVSFLFSFLRPEHEERVAAVLREAGFHVSASSEVLPEFREYERTSTTAIDAYVTPVLDRYLGRLDDELETARLRIMHSNGGSARIDEARRHGVRSILSGPAGGAVGALHVARAAGWDRAITLDMGGTSTDVSLARGGIGLTAEAEIDGLPIRVPVVDLHTVGSGGGSVATVDAGGALRVGPESAGSEPGPACYGRGGRAATVTDAHVVLGRLPPDRFLGGRMRLDAGAAEAALERLGRAAGIGEGTGGLGPARSAALGVIRVVNAQVARALRVISVERGHDPSDFVLVSFGGAGGLHAVALARALGVGRVLVPAGASTLSAFGMLVAPVTRDYVRTVMLPGNVGHRELERRMRPLAERGRREVEAEGVPPDRVELEPALEMRYAGQSYELRVPLAADYVSRFHGEHERAYGHADPEAPVEVVSLRLRAVGRVDPPPLREADPGEADAERALLGRRRVVVTEGRDRGAPEEGFPTGEARTAEVPFFAGGRLRPGDRLAGPAVVVQPDTTVWLPPGSRGEVGVHLDLGIDPGPGSGGGAAPGGGPAEGDGGPRSRPDGGSRP